MTTPRLICLVALVASLVGCAPKQTVVVECRRPDGQIAFYGPATRLTYKNLRRVEELRPSWVIYNSDGYGSVCLIPADCSCIATERTEK